jgi:hypothetical protein
VLDILLPPSFTDTTATGSGRATIGFTGDEPGCDFDSVSYIPLEGDPSSPPSGSAPQGVVFGLVTYTVTGCLPGLTASFTWTLPTTSPPGTQLRMYGPVTGDPTPHWYVLPATISGNQIVG